MALSRRVFGILSELYTRGGRTEYQDMTGVKATGPEQARDFRKASGTVVASYNALLAKEIPAADRSALGRQWDAAITRSGGVTASLQALIIETGKMEPGNSKELWDARTALTTALSYRLFHMQKLSEYARKKKEGDEAGASAAMKVMEISRDYANAEYAKFRRLRY
jgi:hypothetical protein